MMRVFTVNKW